MKYITFLIVLTSCCLPVFASVNIELANGVIIETSGGVFVEIDGDWIYDESSYYCGEISSGSRSGCTGFSGLTFSTGFDGTITCHTGSEYNKDNGEPQNFTRWYELNANSELDPVTVTITFVNHGDIDERNGLINPEIYYIMRYTNPWIKYATTLENTTLTAVSVGIPVGASDWIISNQDPIAVSLISLTAVAENSAITMRWQTACEVNTAGFNILRSTEEDGDGLIINQEMIQTKGDAAMGAAYEYVDFPGESARYYYKLEEVSLDGQKILHGPISVELVTGVLTRLAPPDDFMLCQNYPNPFNPATTIKFGIPKDEDVQLSIYNMRGERIRRLIERQIMAGTYLLVWDGLDDSGRRTPSGIYFCKMLAGHFESIKKMTLAK